MSVSVLAFFVHEGKLHQPRTETMSSPRRGEVSRVMSPDSASRYSTVNRVTCREGKCWAGEKSP